ncbi:MerR family transcriptional regulator [Paenibacillus sp. P26]|nr:MerR family transcriptional regulator [Paenibacillus sp. P26]UUZ90522.1 MerR family transcriptional regulator [Paenibacillus sp. P25]
MLYSISEVARLTGVSAFTLRYYEKIGLLPSPPRQNGKKDGIRRYNDEDLRFIRFVHGLKHTGMNLEDIATFSEDGRLTPGNPEQDKNAILRKRIEILDRHMEQLERQMEHLRAVQAASQEKKEFYSSMLDMPEEKGRESQPPERLKENG